MCTSSRGKSYCLFVCFLCAHRGHRKGHVPYALIRICSPTFPFASRPRYQPDSPLPFSWTFLLVRGPWMRVRVLIGRKELLSRQVVASLQIRILAIVGGIKLP